MQPPARLLDITRLINRAGLQPTGVDRVEVAYLRALLAESIPVFGVARTALGFVLVDRAGAAQVLHALKTDEWGKPDLFGRFNPRLSTPRRLGQSFTDPYVGRLVEIYDKEIESAARDACQRDYLAFGFGNWKAR